MSSSSDIEKLFDHFGGDANAYQEIGRENEARSARTRWPLLVTLDLSQPVIPAIGQQRAVRAPAPVVDTAAADAAADTTPRDAASVTRAKAPLFTRSHRRDIPPVPVAAAKSDTPRGASRFGDVDALVKIDAVTQAARVDAATAAVPGTAQAASATANAVASAASMQAAPVATTFAMPAHAASIPAVAPIAPIVPIAPITSVSSAAPAERATAPAAPLTTFANAPQATQFGATHLQPIPQTHTQAPPQPWTQPLASSTVPAWLQTRAQTPAPTPAAAQQPAASSGTILGRLFAAQPAAAQQPQPAAAPPANAAPLQSVFDRLRGTPAQPYAAPAGDPRAAAPVPSNSWLVNGPRRS